MFFSVCVFLNVRDNKEAELPKWSIIPVFYDHKFASLFKIA